MSHLWHSYSNKEKHKLFCAIENEYGSGDAVLSTILTLNERYDKELEKFHKESYSSRALSSLNSNDSLTKRDTLSLTFIIVFVMEIGLEDLPLHLNTKHKIQQIVIKWRLSCGH